jgi:hypothetical protein
VTDEELNGTHMISELLREGQCLTHQTGNTLAQGVVEALDMIGLASRLADGSVLRHRNHACVHGSVARTAGYLVQRALDNVDISIPETGHEQSLIVQVAPL